MAKSKKAEPKVDCAGFGVAFSEDDSECDVCEVAEDCEVQTAGDADGDSGKGKAATAGKGKGKAAAGKGKGKKAPEPENIDEPNLEDLAETVDNLEKRIEDLETEVAALKESGTGAGKSSRKMSKADKDEKKAELLAECPYSKDELDDLNGREVKLLASALGINSFGMATDDVKRHILKSQKKGKGKGKGKK